MYDDTCRFLAEHFGKVLRRMSINLEAKKKLLKDFDKPLDK
jgi:hypothetical protein